MRGGIGNPGNLPIEAIYGRARWFKSYSIPSFFYSGTELRRFKAAGMRVHFELNVRGLVGK